MKDEFFSEHWSLLPIVMDAAGNLDIPNGLLDRRRMEELGKMMAQLDAEIQEKDLDDLDGFAILRAALAAELNALAVRETYFERIGMKLAERKSLIGKEVRLSKSYQRMLNGRINGIAMFMDKNSLRERFRCPRVIMLKKDGSESAYQGYAPEGSYELARKARVSMKM